MTAYSTKYTYIVADKFSKTLDKFNQKIAFSARGVENASRKMSSLGMTMGAKFTLPFLASARNLQMFDRAMMSVKAVSGATTEEFKKLRQQAIKLGGDTAFTNTQVAEAQNFLAMAGFDVQKIYGAIPATLNLASAANLDMGRSADIVSNIMSGYRLESNELGNAVDVLAKSFTSSNTDLSMLGEGMKLAGPVAKGFGIQFEETVATLGLLGNNAFQGSLGGTALKRAISELAAPTKKSQKILHKLGITTKDTTGKLLPLHNILKQMEERGFTAGDAMEVFGQRAGPAMIALMGEGSVKLEKFTKSLEGSQGVAENIARTKMGGLDGAIKKMLSAIERLNTVMGDAGLTTIIIKITSAITGFANIISDLPAPMKTVIAVTFGILAVMSPLLIAIGQMGIGVVFLSKAMIFLGNTSLILRARLFLLNFSMWQISLTIGAIALIAWAAYTTWKNWDKISPSMKLLFYILSALTVGIWAFNTALLANPLVWIIGAILLGIAALAIGIYGLIKLWKMFQEGNAPSWLQYIYDKFVAISEVVGKLMGYLLDFNATKDLAARAGEKSREFFDATGSFIKNTLGFGGDSKNDTTLTINMNDPKGAVKSVETQSYGNFKPAVNI